MFSFICFEVMCKDYVILAYIIIRNNLLNLVFQKKGNLFNFAEINVLYLAIILKCYNIQNI